MINAVLNVVWLVFGGLLMALGWWLAGLLMTISIIGIPWAKSCFVIGKFALWPFGKEAVSRQRITGQEDIGTGLLGMVGNLLWLLLAGWWLAVGHLTTAIAYLVTIIGIPFGIQHLKLAQIALMPIGKTIVSK